MSTKRESSSAREILEGRVVGGKFSELANYSDLFIRAHDGILLVDLRNFEILESNPAFKEIRESDYASEGEKFSSLFSEKEARVIEQWLREGGAGSLEVEGPYSKSLELTSAKVRLADYCEAYQVIIRDVTAERSKKEALEKLSLTDEMTGLSNFRSFQSRLALEHERAGLKNQTYSIIFADVDHFKHYNDRNGHPAGDVALKKVANAIRSCAGRSEFVARYGGEEFVVLCAGMDGEKAFAFAEKIRSAVLSTEFAQGAAQPLGKVSISLGVSEFAPNLTPAEVLKRADEALYRAKKEGRNRVAIDTPLSTSKRKRA